MPGGEAFWHPLPGSPGGASGLEAFVASSTTSLLVTPMPVAATQVDGLAVVLAASASVRTALVSAVVEHSDPGAARRFDVAMDGTSVWPAAASGAESRRMSDTGSTGYQWTVAGVVVSVPGDSISHTIKLRWQAQGNTNGTELRRRSMTVLTF